MIDLDQFLNIAHRGARSLAPENTLLAARKALAMGASGWELDVAMTTDGELVVMHDDTLTRTSNAAQVFPARKPWNIYTFSLAELRSLDCGSWYAQTDPFKQIAQGAVHPDELQTYAGAMLPTLREALEFTRAEQWWVNIEIKDAAGTPADERIVPAVVRLVEDLEMADRVLISSFNHRYIVQVKALNPRIATGALTEKPILDPVGLLQRTGAQAYNPGAYVLLPGQVHMLRNKGYAVYVWTVNEETAMRRLMKAGVSGLFTDFPQRLAAVLAQI